MHLATVSAYESGVAMPQTNVTKEIYRLAMREGHDTEDFSAIYEYLSNDSDFATIEQKSPAPAKAQRHQANLNISFYEDRGAAYAGLLNETRFDRRCNRSRDRY